MKKVRSEQLLLQTYVKAPTPTDVREGARPRQTYVKAPVCRGRRLHVRLSGSGAFTYV